MNLETQVSIYRRDDKRNVPIFCMPNALKHEPGHTTFHAQIMIIVGPIFYSLNMNSIHRRSANRYYFYSLYAERPEI